MDLKEKIDLRKKKRWGGVARELLKRDFAKQRGENAHEIHLGGNWDNN